MLRWVVLALTAVTGFTGLAYEVTWQRYLGILLGAHSERAAARSPASSVRRRGGCTATMALTALVPALFTSGSRTHS